MGSSSSSRRNSRRPSLSSSSSAVPPKNQGKKYSHIGDYYFSIDENTAALSKAGLESSNPIVRIDVTKSNERTEERSFNKKTLHDVGPLPNPYEQAISIIGKTLSSFKQEKGDEINIEFVCAEDF